VQVENQKSRTNCQVERMPVPYFRNRDFLDLSNFLNLCSKNLNLKLETLNLKQNIMKIAVIDNYDSFTYNLVHYLEDLNANVTVFRNDEFELNELEKFDKILLSPGPGIPDEAGLLKDVIKKYASTKSIFGVCLGLQAICEVFGGQLTNLEKVYHGVATKVTKTEDDFIFNNLPNEFEVGRYHSWVVSNENLPADLIVTSTDENGQIMSMKHGSFDVRGVQYHPESVLTPFGKKILENWLQN